MYALNFPIYPVPSFWLLSTDSTRCVTIEFYLLAAPPLYAPVRYSWRLEPLARTSSSCFALVERWYILRAVSSVLLRLPLSYCVVISLFSKASATYATVVYSKENHRRDSIRNIEAVRRYLHIVLNILFIHIHVQHDMYRNLWWSILSMYGSS